MILLYSSELTPLALAIKNTTTSLSIHPKINQLLMVLFTTLGLSSLPSSSGYAASFPTPGTTQTYNIPATIDGTVESILELNTNGQVTTLNVDNALLNILNFNSSNGRAITVTSGAILNVLTEGINGSVSFEDNSVATTGGAISSFQSTIVLGDNMVFANNQATEGGGIYTNASTLTIGDNVKFIGNYTSGNGAGIFTLNSTVILGNNALFSNNSSSPSGGGALIANSSTLTIGDNANFINNATIALAGSGSTLNIGNNSNFSGNESALLLVNNNTVNFLVDNNTTTRFTGNIYTSNAQSMIFASLVGGVNSLTINTGNSGDSNTALFDMRDPMRTFYVGTMIINKNDNGIWALGGDNNFTSSNLTNFNINSGTLYLYAADEVANPSTLYPTANVAVGQINIQGVSSGFALGSSATLAAGGLNSIVVGTGSINIADGATIRGGSATRSLGGNTPINEQGNTTSLTLTANSGTQLSGVLNLQALDTIDNFTLNAVLNGAAGRIVKSGLGTAVLTGVNTYAAGTLINEGILSVNQNSNLGDVAGPLIFNGGALENTGVFTTNRDITLNADGGRFITDANLTVDNIVNGTGNLIKDGLASLLLNATNAYTGSTIVNNGTLQLFAENAIASSALVNLSSNQANVTMATNQTLNDLTGVIGSSVDLGNNTLTLNSNNNGEFAGRLNGTGNIVKTGAATLTLSGDSSAFTGSTIITNGMVALNGILNGDITVQSSGKLKGSGQATNVAIDGVIAPGNSIGTLLVAGNYTQNSGSTYEVEINAAGQSDLIAVGNAATINGGTVAILKTGTGNYLPDTQYTILSAAGGVTGQYNALMQLNLPFLDFLLSYDANNVYLNVSRNTLPFQSFASTFNQINTAAAVDSLSVFNPIVVALMNSTSATDEQAALDSLSGEIHVSALSGWIEDSRYVRDAALNRLQTAPFYQANNVQLEDKGVAWWSQGFGAWGDLSGDSNAAELNRSNQGIFIGVDRAFGENGRVGLLGGYSNSQYQVTERNSRIDSDNYHLAGYAGIAINQIALRAGAAYSWLSIDSQRSVFASNFYNALHANYDGKIAQGFVEAAYEFNLSTWHWAPFVSIADVSAETNRWTEQGGVAALQGKGDENVFYSHLGMRESSNLSRYQQADIGQAVTLAWRHAYSHITPVSTLAFASGSETFTIAGTPLAEDSFILDASLFVKAISKPITARLAYSGQIAHQTQDHAIYGNVVWQFD